MNHTDYQRILFKTALLVMACDGEIHPDEIKELELAFNKSSLFKDLVFHEELGRMTAEIEQAKKQAVMSYFQSVESEELDSVQKLQILEVMLRIMYADNRIDPNEIRFFKLVKSRLGIMDEIFFKRFGDVDFLPSNQTSEKATDSASAFVDEIEFPEFGDLIEIHGDGKA